MSEQPSSPLQEAQNLVAQLLEQASDAESLKSGLTQVKALLAQAVKSGEGEEPESLRQKLNSVLDQNATFTSLMVHEIRKPMTSIRGYSDMLAKPGLIGTLNDQQQQFIDTVRNNIIRMEGLVSDISDINKLNSGRLRLDSKMTTFGQVIMEVQKLVEPVNTEFQHQITWDIPQGLPILNTDGKQLAKVVGNVVKNACQYTPKGGQITVRAERLDGNVLKVVVTDTGIGMKPEEIARLGEAFYRADHELVTMQKGYGLGIPIAMGFLSLMNSRLNCESVFGQGTTFSFELVGIG